MATSKHVQWTVLADGPRAVELITGAAGPARLTVTHPSPTTLEVGVPGRVLRNRPASTLTATVTPGEAGTQVDWTLPGRGSTAYEHLLTLAERLPDGALHDHGIREAAARVGLRIFGRRQTRYLADILDQGESVLAVGAGVLATKPGIVALTGRRLVFVRQGSALAELVEFPISAVTALSPRSQRGGEGLTVAQAGTLASISQMGPGQADLIAAAFADLKGASAPVDATADAPPADPIAQIERLASLRDKGILSEEEFQTQKAKLLSRL
jgi:hypothetical protein